jgi:rhodanese-related sulfurtransferase
MHGQRAWLVRKVLALKGYRNLVFLEGFLEEWLSAGLPWEKPSS